MLTGTIINALAIVVGSAAGLLLKAGGGFAAKRFPSLGGGAAGIRLGERLQDIIMKGVALCVLYIGISGCLKGSNTLAAILSMVLGAIIGELLDLDRRMQSLGDWVQEKTAFLSRGDAPLHRFRGLRHRLPPLLRGRHGHCGVAGKRPHGQLRHT